MEQINLRGEWRTHRLFPQSAHSYQAQLALPGVLQLRHRSLSPQEPPRGREGITLQRGEGVPQHDGQDRRCPTTQTVANDHKFIFLQTERQTEMNTEKAVGDFSDKSNHLEGNLLGQ